MNPYRFENQNREIVLSRYNMPTPWMNYLSNGTLHAMISQAGGGVAWYRSPQIWRINHYRFFHLPTDRSGFYTYIKDGNAVWCPTSEPCACKPEKWEAAHGMGYTRFTAERDGLRTEVTYLVSPLENVMLWHLELRSDRDRDVTIYPYVELGMMEFMRELQWQCYNKHQLSVYEKDGVLTGGETKLGLVSDDIIPNKVCLIPDLLKTLPYKPFACSAIDALVHATESFLSPHRKTMTSELFSEKAMDMILKGFKLIDEKGQDARFEYLDEFVTASFYAGIAFLKAGCGPVHGMSFPLGGTYHVPHGESNYMLFGAIMDYYDANKPDGEIMKFKELVARILGCEVKDAIPEMNALLQRILPLRPLRDCGFTEADFKIFPQSVETNQQRLMTNAYYPFDLESEEAIYRKCY